MFVKIKEMFSVTDHHKALHTGFHGTHAVYFGAALMEGHGVYAIAAGALFIFTVLNWFFPFE